MKSTLQRAIDTYGTTNQILMAIEEMAELTTELSHHLRGRDNRVMVLGEIADCLVMLHQLRIMFGEEDVDTWFHAKIERLHERLMEDQMEGKH